MADGARVIDVNLVGSNRVVPAFEAILQPGSAVVVFASMAAYLIPSDPALDAILDDPEAPDLLDRLDALGLTDHSGLAYSVSKRGVIRLVERRAEYLGRKRRPNRRCRCRPASSTPRWDAPRTRRYQPWP